MPAKANKPSNQGLVIKTSAGLYDLSEQYAAATPAPIGLFDTRRLAGRKSPKRTPTRDDLSYVLAGLLESASGEAKALRNANLAGETINLLETQSDNKHWWQANLLVPRFQDADGPLFQFEFTMPGDGSAFSHGRLIDGALKTAQNIKNVPAGALGLVAIIVKGNLTALNLRMAIAGTNYDFSPGNANPGIAVGLLKRGSSSTPSAAAATLTIQTTPANASGYKLIAGFGIYGSPVVG